MTWTTMDAWIVAAGALSAVACALPGNFLVLRRMSMMGDAISHAVLPGLAAAFLLTGSRSGPTMFLGAAIVGVLTALFTEWITRFGKVEESASMGVVFTTLFAIGLLAIVRAADHVDLDPGCVLYGAIELTPLNTVRVAGVMVPRVVLTIGGVLLVNVLFVVLLFKELRICAFDPELATTVGVSARLMHYALMTIVAVTTVACFESVGSILVIAMLIVPPATAYLLTDRLERMVWLSAGIALLSALGGHWGAIALPGCVGYPGMSTNTAGMMAVVAGLFLFVALLASPRHGILARLWRRRRLELDILREDVLGLVYRLEEHGAGQVTVAPAVMRSALGVGPLLYAALRAGLRRRGHLARLDGEDRITEAGRAAAGQLVRSHRLWESYLHKHLALRDAHAHATAGKLEHVTDLPLRRRLAERTDEPVRDPQGRPIPPPE